MAGGAQHRRARLRADGAVPARDPGGDRATRDQRARSRRPDLDAFAAYQQAHPDKVAFTLPTLGTAPSGSGRHHEGTDWAKVADQLAHDDNPLGIPAPPRTAFEAKMRREGARRGFLRIRQTGAASTGPSVTARPMSASRTTTTSTGKKWG